jgi:hypothetical protein
MTAEQIRALRRLIKFSRLASRKLARPETVLIYDRTEFGRAEFREFGEGIISTVTRAFPELRAPQ